MLRFVALSICLFAAACSSNSERIEARAREAALERHVVESGGLRSLIYMKRGIQPNRPIFIFLEGDGQPWRAGIEPNLDPTTGNPLALELLTHTPQFTAYVSRPCYQGVTSTRCSPLLWTSARYSLEVVEAMLHAVQEIVRRSQPSQTIFVGHSGGGTLALLIAERMRDVTGVVTIAANLDTTAWTTHHGYLPLSESLNPAHSTIPHPWAEIHIAGRRDQVVPIETASAYFERYPNAERWVLDEHSHVCCWLEEWPVLWEKIERALDLE